MKKLALVLGGGAAKGYAHVGVIKELEKNGIMPDLIVGTSMGALVGGMYASGKTITELETLASKFNSLGSFSLISTLFKDNILNINNVKKILNKELSEKTFEECKIKFVSIATDLKTGEMEKFSSGNLKDGVMASISIPGVFPRCKVNGKYYADGGIVNNLPEDVAREILPDAVIVSVDVLGDYPNQIEHCKMKTVESLVNAITIFITNNTKNKPQVADLRLSLTMPSVSQLDFSAKSSEKTIRKGQLYAKKHIAKIKELLKGD